MFLFHTKTIQMGAGQKAKVFFHRETSIHQCKLDGNTAGCRRRLGSVGRMGQRGHRCPAQEFLVQTKLLCVKLVIFHGPLQGLFCT